MQKRKKVNLQKLLPAIFLTLIISALFLAVKISYAAAPPPPPNQCGKYRRCQDGGCNDPNRSCKKYQWCLVENPDGSCKTYEWGCRCLTGGGPTSTPSDIPLPTQPHYGPIPSPYVPCDEVRPTEFHSLRPYQASPCNQELADIALFCGNDLIVFDSITILKRFLELPLGDITYPHIVGIYSHEDTAILHPPCTDNGDGTETCWFAIPREKQILVDLSMAYLPIMGNTEIVVNSQRQPVEVMPDYLDDPAKVNEYISWFLNGIIGRAEYDPPTLPSYEEERKMVDYSGPLKKLHSWESQIVRRIEEINRAGVDRHNQIVGCRSGGDPEKCYPGNATRTRLDYWTNQGNLPPLQRDYNSFTAFWNAYRNWYANNLGRLYQYVPFSSMEDRMGEAEMQTSPIQYIASNLFLTDVILLNNIPADLFFAHMQESYELADFLQQMIVPAGFNREQ